MERKQFQTSIYIRRSSDACFENLLSHLIQKVRNWIQTVERHLPMCPKCDNLPDDFLRCSGKLSGTESDLRTQHFIEFERKDITAWACSYIHKDKESNLLRWKTEIGIRKIDNDICVFHIVVTMIPDPTLLDQRLPDRKPAIPRIIRKLVDEKGYLVSLDKSFLLSLQRSPHVVTVDNKKALNCLTYLLKDPVRSYVLIVCRGKQLDAVARELGQNLVSKAQIILIDDGPEIASILSVVLEKDYYLESEKIRVFFPPNLQGGKTYDPYSEKFDKQKERLVESLLSNFEVKAFGTVQSVEEVDSLIRMSQMRHRLTSHKTNDDRTQDGLEKELQAAESLIDESAKALEAEQEITTKLQEEKDALNDRIKDLNEELNNERVQAREWEKMSEIKKENDSLHSFLLKLDKLPNLASILAIMKERFKDRIIIHENAVQSAEKYAEFTHLSEAWSLLYGMGSTLYDLKFRFGTFSEQTYNNCSNYELSMKEGRLTKKDSRLMNERKIEYKGVDYDLSPHVKYGNRVPKCLRVHFCFLEQEQKILIGYVGPHLDNATTRKCK